MDHLTLTQHKPAASVLWAAITTPPIAFHDFGLPHPPSRFSRLSVP